MTSLSKGTMLSDTRLKAPESFATISAFDILSSGTSRAWGRNKGRFGSTIGQRCNCVESTLSTLSLVLTHRREASQGAYNNPCKSTQLHLDAVQGRNEQRTESYFRYGEGVAKLLTPQCAKLSRCGQLCWTAGKSGAIVWWTSDISYGNLYLYILKTKL
jgi:hypothetical protein